MRIFIFASSGFGSVRINSICFIHQCKNNLIEPIYQKNYFILNVKVSSTDKLKAMFLSIWRHIHSTMQEQLVSYKGSTTGTNYGHSGGFLRGSQVR